MLSALLLALTFAAEAGGGPEPPSDGPPPSVVGVPPAAAGAAATTALLEAIARLEPVPPFGPAGFGPGDAGKTALPEAVSWEAFTRDPTHQGATGTCALFAEVAATEVQYALNNCDAPGVFETPPAGCLRRHGDDDPRAADHGLLRLDDRGRAVLDLSEQLILSCSGLGYAWGGSAVWPFMNERGDNRGASFDPYRPYALKYSRTGWGYWQWLDRVGTVQEAAAPYRFPYELPGLHGHAEAYERLVTRLRDERFPGTCPLVHRFGGGDPDGHDRRRPPRPFADDGCEIAQVAAQAGAGVPVFFRVPLAAHRRLGHEQALAWLAAGYVLVDVVGGPLEQDPDRPGRLRCASGACKPFDPSCVGHVILLIGFEDSGETLIVRDSNGSIYRVRRGDCGFGAGELTLLLLGDDPWRPAGPSVLALPAPSCTREEHRELYRWLRDDSDGDGIRNGWDVCLYSPNPRSIDREAPGDDHRIVGPGRLLEPVFEDGDAWPDERFELGDDEWDPALGLRSGCDTCPGLPVAQPAWRYPVPHGFRDDPDPWGWVCDGCPYSAEWSFETYRENVPTDENDADGDGITGCDTCPELRSYDPRGLVDTDDDGLGAACDPDQPER